MKLMDGNRNVPMFAVPFFIVANCLAFGQFGHQQGCQNNNKLLLEKITLMPNDILYKMQLN